MKAIHVVAVIALASLGLSCAGGKSGRHSDSSFGAGRYSGFGLRAGVVSTVNESGTLYEDGPTAGLCHAGALGRKILYEVSADAAKVASASGDNDAMLYSFRMDLIMAQWNRISRKVHPYLLVGGGGMYSVVEGTTDISETVGAADVGVGLLTARSMWDLRLLGTAAVGSDNVEMLASLTLGKRF